MSPNLVLKIDELVLHGFAPGDHYRLGEALTGELQRLFVERGVPPALAQASDVDLLDAGRLTVASDAKAEVVGARIAQVLYARLSQ
jgi:hypothetical protein